MKFQATFEVSPDFGPEDNAFKAEIEGEAEGALMDLGYSNVEVKVVS